MREYQNYVDGEWVEALSGETMDTTNPSTGEAVSRVPKGGRDDAQRAVAAARRAFDGGEWSDMPVERRVEIVRDVANRILDKVSDIAAIETDEAGQTIRMSSLFGIPLAPEHMRAMCSTMLSLPELEPLPFNNYPAVSWNLASYEPYGVCGQIIPWNYPFIMAVWKMMPALLTGNCVVVKPASYTPSTALELAKIMEEAGVPKGVVNVITGPGGAVGEELCTSAGVDKIAFTGSTEVGRRVMQMASGTVKKVTLELGGKSASILLEDADLDVAVPGALWGTFLHAGQICESGTRLLVPSSIYDEVCERLKAVTETLKVGPASDFDSDLGPVVSAAQLKTVMDYVQIGLKEGAKLLTGGERLTGGDYDKGYFHQPTIFVDVDNSMTIAQEEIFGPVLSVIKYDTPDQAVKIANDSIYGLGGSVWSTDIPQAIAIARKIRTGTVWINDFHLINGLFPFGGYKQSGVGRELGSKGLREYQQVKHIHVDQTPRKDQKFWYMVLGV
ncbi:MAG: aldehyde dehydrogenase family protein [Actinomycetota bacterium]